MSDAVVGGEAKKSKWRWIVIVVAILISAAVAGATVRLWQSQKDKKEQAVSESIDQSQQAAVSGDFDQAHAEINNQLSQPRLTDSQRYSLLLQQGLTYENQGKYQQAIAAYREAAQIEQTSAIYEAIARAATAADNKQLAVESYQKAISLLSSNQPNYQGKKSFYQNSIKALSE